MKASAAPSPICIRFYLDFDGTLTDVPGGKLVFTPEYEAVLGEDYNYKNPPADNPQNVSSIKQRILDNINASIKKISAKPFKMRAETIHFLDNTLAKGADVCIVSKNHTVYIKAVLLANGLTEESVARITFFDSTALTSTMFGKRDIIKNHEADSSTRPATHIHLVDDDAADIKSMLIGVIRANKLRRDPATVFCNGEEMKHLKFTQTTPIKMFDTGSYNWIKEMKIVFDKLGMTAEAEESKQLTPEPVLKRSR